ncbi:MAG: hypothetical protein HY820_08635 [Acidobacteria bacterium]|nr:hypothetical protein [Acidobacteriota bacterium]
MIELLGMLQFGTIGGLQIRGGEPMLTPAPRVVQKLKLGADSTNHPGANLDDFWLKRPVIELLNAIADIGDGEILSLEIRHGLPVVLQLERGQFDDRGGRNG